MSRVKPLNDLYMDYINTLLKILVTSALSLTPDGSAVSVGPSTDPLAGLCTDRYGYLPVENFHHRSCTLCYLHLFLYNKALKAVRPYESLSYQNQSASEDSGPIVPDPRNETLMLEVCSTLNAEECQRWRACCNAAVDCCSRQLRTPRPPREDAHVCLRTWDGYSCWDDAQAGSRTYTSCPPFMGTASESRRAVKECTVNGTWVKKQGLGWTDYTTCIDMEAFLVNVYICVGCNSASMLLLLPSIVIFLLFRDLSRQHRIRLHINFFLSLLFRSVVVILWFLLVHHEKLTNTEATEAVMILNPIWCRVLSFFKIYFDSTTFTWMFCEGYYLHRLISRAFEPPKSLITLYVIGWGFPAIPAIVYSILRVFYNNDSCWAFNIGAKEWVLYFPNLACLVLNIVFLCNILRILLFQLHSHPHEPSSFRRGLKAAFMLIPLFGIQLALTIYRPNMDTMQGNLKAYEYTTTIVTNSQGFFVSLVFCFFNGEVLAHFHNHCSPCCQRCTKHFIRRRSPSTHMTQITFTEDHRSPTNSVHSHSSTSPKKNGRYSVNGYKDIDLQDMTSSRESSRSSLCKHQTNGSPDKNDAGYVLVPTTPAVTETSRV